MSTMCCLQFDKWNNINRVQRFLCIFLLMVISSLPRQKLSRFGVYHSYALVYTFIEYTPPTQYVICHIFVFSYLCKWDQSVCVRVCMCYLASIFVFFTWHCFMSFVLSFIYLNFCETVSGFLVTALSSSLVGLSSIGFILRVL